MSMATDAMEREIEDDAYDRGFEDGVKFREATLEERNSVDAYIKSISVDVEKEIRADERAKAEIEFQNSDYWNDYLAKVIADARAEERAEIVDLIDRLMWTYSKEVWEDFQPNLKKLKEQK